MLFATIAQYVESGRPVGSSTVARNSQLGLSPASIRRILNDLSLAGLLIQPHTSAGRIPTDMAFRLFVDELQRGANEIDDSTIEALSNGLKDLIPNDADSWRETVQILSRLSTQAALVITPAISDALLRQLRFIPLEGNELLAVIVTRDGIVHNSYLSCEQPVNERELEKMHNYLKGQVIGHSLNEVRGILKHEIEDARLQCDRLRERAAMLGARALENSVGKTSKLVVEGRDRLVKQPELEGRLSELMSALEHKSKIVELLDKAAESDEGPLVIIGAEGGENFDGCTLISASFGADTGPVGTVGIIGPTRMNYPTMIPLVMLSAQMLSSNLKKS